MVWTFEEKDNYEDEGLPQLLLALSYLDTSSCLVTLDFPDENWKTIFSL